MRFSCSMCLELAFVFGREEPWLEGRRSVGKRSVGKRNRRWKSMVRPPFTHHPVQKRNKEEVACESIYQSCIKEYTQFIGRSRSGQMATKAQKAILENSMIPRYDPKISAMRIN